MHERHGRCVIAVSEGIHDARGQPILAQLAKDLERDAHGNVQLSGSGALADLLCEEIKRNLGIKRVRGDTFGYLQRSFVGCVSDVDQREAREVGEKAVQFAMWGDRDGSVAIQRSGYYSADYALVPLEAVAGKTRVMEDEFIAASGTDVTARTLRQRRQLIEASAPERLVGGGPGHCQPRRADTAASGRRRRARVPGSHVVASSPVRTPLPGPRAAARPQYWKRRLKPYGPYGPLGPASPVGPWPR